jgi:hypothetical protein
MDEFTFRQIVFAQILAFQFHPANQVSEKEQAYEIAKALQVTERAVDQFYKYEDIKSGRNTR